MNVKTLLIIFFLLNLITCTKIEKIYLLPERDEIVDALYEIIASDGVFSIDGLNDGGAYILDYSSSSLGKATFPDTAEYSIDDIKIGRQITQVLDTTIIYDIKWDSAYVNIKYYFKGTFKIILTIEDSSISYIVNEWSETRLDIDSTYNEMLEIFEYDTNTTIVQHQDTLDSDTSWFRTAVDSTTKSFNHQTEQKAVFLRTQNTDNASKDWQIKKVTPIIFRPINESFIISEVELSTSGNSSSITMPEDDDIDLLETYFVRDSLPEVDYQGNLILSSVTVTNSDPYPDEPGEVVLTHFGQGLNVYKIRTGLTDSNDDGIHTGSFTVNSHGSQVYRLFIDAIDYRTIFTRTGSYNAHILMIPFRVP